MPLRLYSFIGMIDVLIGYYHDILLGQFPLGLKGNFTYFSLHILRIYRWHNYYPSNLFTLIKHHMRRRSFIQKSFFASGLVMVGNSLMYASKDSYVESLAFELPPLPYAFDALEPFIDKQTMEIHHGKHHAAYVKNFNKEAEGNKYLQGKTVEAICSSVSKFNTAVRNNAGGHYNHSLFWKLLSPNSGQPSKRLSAAITKDFGSLEMMKGQFNEAAKSRFGSGWAWLIYAGGKLKIVSTPNQDNPLMDVAETKGYPLVALDIWEHAYYLKYQNRRPDYIDAFWKIVNWEEVSKRYELAVKK